MTDTYSVQEGVRWTIAKAINLEHDLQRSKKHRLPQPELCSLYLFGLGDNQTHR